MQALIRPIDERLLGRGVDAGEAPAGFRCIVREQSRHAAIFGADLHDLLGIRDPEGVENDLGKFAHRVDQELGHQATFLSALFWR